MAQHSVFRLNYAFARLKIYAFHFVVQDCRPVEYRTQRGIKPASFAVHQKQIVMKKINLLLAVLLFMLAQHVYAQEIVNGGFELPGGKSISRNWIFEPGKSAYKIDVDSTEKHSGKYALRVTDTSNTAHGNKGPGIIANLFGVNGVKKVITVELKAWLKFTVAQDSTIALFIQNQRGDKIVHSYVKNPDPSNRKWQQVQLSFTADEDFAWYGFYYGVEISAKGTVWVDDLQLKVNGERISDPASFLSEPAPKDIKWLNANLHPLKYIGTEGSNEDLKPIADFIAGARIVALGEPTHGTHEAFQFKLRAIEYLVVNKGFTTIALEEVIPICDIMNGIVNSNNQSIKDSLMSLPFYKIWQTAEMLEVLEWVGKYNRSNPVKKVNFIGMDMEDLQIKTSRKLLRAYGAIHNQPIFNQMKIIDNRLDSLLKISRKGSEDPTVMLAADQLKLAFKQMYELLESEAVHIADKDEMYKLKSYIRVGEQWLASRFYEANRDEFLADNIKFYADAYPDHKVVIWAHNFHVAYQSLGVVQSMGTLLKGFFAQEFVSLGFTSAQGYYVAAEDYSKKKWSVYPFEKAYRGTYEYVLAKANQDFYFLPLNQKNNAVTGASWLNMPMKHLDNGYIQAGSDDDYKFYGNLNTVFDGLIFCRETTGAHSYWIK